VGPRAGLDAGVRGKKCSYAGDRTPAVHSVARHYTELPRLTKYCLLVVKNSARKRFLRLGSSGATILGPKEEEFGPP
jgi:hypothetical protein